MPNRQPFVTKGDIVKLIESLSFQLTTNWCRLDDSRVTTDVWRTFGTPLKVGMFPHSTTQCLGSEGEGFDKYVLQHMGQESSYDTANIHWPPVVPEVLPLMGAHFPR